MKVEGFFLFLMKIAIEPNQKGLRFSEKKIEIVEVNLRFISVAAFYREENESLSLYLSPVHTVSTTLICKNVFSFRLCADVTYTRNKERNWASCARVLSQSLVSFVLCVELRYSVCGV